MTIFEKGELKETGPRPLLRLPTLADNISFERYQFETKLKLLAGLPGEISLSPDRPAKPMP